MTCELATITSTPIRTITRPTTSTAYCATATMVPLGRCGSGSSASIPGASPEASSQDELGASSFFLFFDPFLVSGSAPADSLVVLTTDHPPADVDAAAGARVGAGASGSAGFGAGVHDGSLGGIGVGSGAGRKGSTGGAGAGEKGSGGAVVAGGKSQPVEAGAGAWVGVGVLGTSQGMGEDVGSGRAAGA